MIKAIESNRVAPNFKSAGVQNTVKATPAVSFGAQEFSKAASSALSSNFQASQKINANKTISFTGEKNNQEAKLGAGLAFVATLGASIYAAKNAGDTKGYFDSLKEGFEVNEAEQAIASGAANINFEEGIYQIAGTGINIDPDRFDYVDAENGIFKNYDGSVDIDLFNNKFVDFESGIFVDPANNLSAIMSDGLIQSIIIPDVTFGSGYPTGWGDGRWSTLQRHRAASERESSSEETQSFWDKLKGFFGIDNTGDKGALAEAFSSAGQDIFGRDIAELQNIKVVSMDDFIESLNTTIDIDAGETIDTLADLGAENDILEALTDLFGG
ncbi:hypothetical protein tpqmel_0552 [Candidatus Gastranaerophilus sp. (ex Termes propinquus)]|nr:hypothetical protein tpqmel_0552 [Candidatus Gastranaerophilus sp. (ex Termes propinquus)]